MQKVLLVRTSSMGDLIHTLPAITDLSRVKSDVKLSWLVEEDFVDIAKLHPFVNDVLVVKWRKYFKNITSISLLFDLIKLRNSLKKLDFNLTIDSQGLLKSAIPAHWAGSKLVGYDKYSIKESIASYLYDETYSVSRDLSAVERNRKLFGLIFGYKPVGLPCFGIHPPVKYLRYINNDYVILLHGSSRDSKLWSNDYWVKLANLLYSNYGLISLLPWGNRTEKERTEYLSSKIKKSIIIQKLTLYELAALLGDARLVIGVDTGLLHLANALNIPSIGLYMDTDPKLTGVINTPISFNLGGINKLPQVEDVMSKIKKILI